MADHYVNFNVGAPQVYPLERPSTVAPVGPLEYWVWSRSPTVVYGDAIGQGDNLYFTYTFPNRENNVVTRLISLDLMLYTQTGTAINGRIANALLFVSQYEKPTRIWWPTRMVNLSDSDIMCSTFFGVSKVPMRGAFLRLGVNPPILNWPHPNPSIEFNEMRLAFRYAQPSSGSGFPANSMRHCLGAICEVYPIESFKDGRVTDYLNGMYDPAVDRRKTYPAAF